MDYWYEVASCSTSRRLLVAQKFKGGDDTVWLVVAVTVVAVVLEADVLNLGDLNCEVDQC